MTIVTEHGNGSGAAAAPGQLRLLFFVRSIHYDRVLENFLRAVLERGHDAPRRAGDSRSAGLGTTKTQPLRRVARALRLHVRAAAAAQRARGCPAAVALRHGLDYLRYLEPEFAHADPLRERARARAPRLLRRCSSRFRSFRGRRPAARARRARSGGSRLRSRCHRRSTHSSRTTESRRRPSVAARRAWVRPRAITSVQRRS